MLKKSSTKDKRRLAVRARNINIALFVFAAVIMAVAMLEVVRDITKQISAEYAKLHADKTAGIFNAYVDRNAGLAPAAELDLARMAEECFAGYDNSNVRGFVIDEKGAITMDSSSLGKDASLRRESKSPIEDIVSDPAFLAAVKAHLAATKEYFAPGTKPVIIALSSGPYDYATIAPIAFTNWTVIIVYKSSSLFDLAKLLRFFAIMLGLFIAFALAGNVLGYRLIFKPLGQLIDSLSQLKENTEGDICGAERNDEFGILARTIHGLLYEAHRDQLTGLYNRRFLEKSLQRTIESLSRSNGTLSVLVIDVDFFKNYNDTYGHDMGDVCLEAIATELAKDINRADDFVARYGGEEFVAVLPSTDENGARVVANKLLANIQELNIPHKGSAIASHVTVSIGGATGSVTHTQSRSDYLRLADKALYISKQSGRHCYTWLALEQEPAYL